MARTNISVDQTVFEEFASQAERQNKTLFAFANESLSAVAKISSEGGNPAELYRLWRSVSLLKQIDVITLPSDFIDELIAKIYSLDKPSLLNMFRNLGSELVGVLKIAAENLDELGQLAKDFTALLPVKQFKISRLDGSSVEIGIVGAGRRIESTECTLEFLKSILNGYGYTVTKNEINVGTIRLWASKRSE
ncbi:MAG: hypothetical protein JRN20_13570, partial [Nitrososphaerota archaeon]|nr:hypothetical protein [Nitrososphaerota archaeon]